MSRYGDGVAECLVEKVNIFFGEAFGARNGRLIFIADCSLLSSDGVAEKNEDNCEQPLLD